MSERECLIRRHKNFILDALHDYRQEIAMKDIPFYQIKPEADKIERLIKIVEKIPVCGTKIR